MDTKYSSLGLKFCTFACIWFAYVVQVSLCSSPTLHRKISRNNSNSFSGVQLQINDSQHVVLDNGIVQVTLSKPDGLVTGIKYNTIDNLLELNNGEDDRGYWDVYWYKPGDSGSMDKLQGADFKVIMQSQNQVEVSFTRTWTVSTHNSTVPLNVDTRYIMQRGSSGFYMYAILERLAGWPDVDIDQIRIVFKLSSDKFNFMAISDDKQRFMPTLQDRTTGRALAYPEAVLLTHPSDLRFRGEVDDKYQYSIENKENKVQGWISKDSQVGFWIITPSYEFCGGGPMKQDLTSHAGPILLSMFTSVHYTGKDLNTQFRNGEQWKKVFGPIFVHLNSAPGKYNNYQKLWADAKNQMSIEVANWPYNFPQSPDFPYLNKRGSVAGQLLIQDKYVNNSLASFAYVGLAAPGIVGSWQNECKGYQFWTQADKAGNFLIKNVRVGVYNLYAWVPGIIGDYRCNDLITIKPEAKINLGRLRYAPPRNGPTLWEIGLPDRSAEEFFVPAPKPTLTNRLYTRNTKDRYRQYGLWDQYTYLYPRNDLIYNVATSKYNKDWPFAHVPRNKGTKKYQATTWQIVFQLSDVSQIGNYTVQLALASATQCNLQVRFNDERANPPHFSTGYIGKDNAIARHGIHGLYRLYSINVPANQLQKGSNTIYLTQARADSAYTGVMYDYIRLEGPTQVVDLDA